MLQKTQAWVKVLQIKSRRYNQLVSSNKLKFETVGL